MSLHKQFIDDLFLMWTSPPAELCYFRHAVATADEAISLGCCCYKSHQDTANFSAVTAEPIDRSTILTWTCCELLDLSLKRQSLVTSFLY